MTRTVIERNHDIKCIIICYEAEGRQAGFLCFMFFVLEAG
jgi:hypothetical protein